MHRPPALPPASKDARSRAASTAPASSATAKQQKRQKQDTLFRDFDRLAPDDLLAAVRARDHCPPPSTKRQTAADVVAAARMAARPRLDPSAPSPYLSSDTKSAVDFVRRYPFYKGIRPASQQLGMVLEPLPVLLSQLSKAEAFARDRIQDDRTAQLCDLFDVACQSKLGVIEPQMRLRFASAQQDRFTSERAQFIEAETAARGTAETEALQLLRAVRRAYRRVAAEVQATVAHREQQEQERRQASDDFAARHAEFFAAQIPALFATRMRPTLETFEETIREVHLMSSERRARRRMELEFRNGAQQLQFESGDSQHTWLRNAAKALEQEAAAGREAIAEDDERRKRVDLTVAMLNEQRVLRETILIPRKLRAVEAAEAEVRVDRVQSAERLLWRFRLEALMELWASTRRTAALQHLAEFERQCSSDALDLVMAGEAVRPSATLSSWSPRGNATAGAGGRGGRLSLIPHAVGASLAIDEGSAAAADETASASSPSGPARTHLIDGLLSAEAGSPQSSGRLIDGSWLVIPSEAIFLRLGRWALARDHALRQLLQPSHASTLAAPDGGKKPGGGGGPTGGSTRGRRSQPAPAAIPVAAALSGTLSVLTATTLLHPPADTINLLDEVGAPALAAFARVTMAPVHEAAHRNDVLREELTTLATVVRTSAAFLRHIKGKRGFRAMLHRLPPSPMPTNPSVFASSATSAISSAMGSSCASPRGFDPHSPRLQMSTAKKRRSGDFSTIADGGEHNPHRSVSDSSAATGVPLAHSGGSGAQVNSADLGPAAIASTSSSCFGGTAQPVGSGTLIPRRDSRPIVPRTDDSGSPGEGTSSLPALDATVDPTTQRTLDAERTGLGSRSLTTRRPMSTPTSQQRPPSRVGGAVEDDGLGNGTTDPPASRGTTTC